MQGRGSRFVLILRVGVGVGAGSVSVCVSESWEELGWGEVRLAVCFLPSFFGIQFLRPR